MKRLFEGFSNTEDPIALSVVASHPVILQLIDEQLSHAEKKADQAANDPNVEQEYWRGWYNGMRNLRNKLTTR